MTPLNKPVTRKTRVMVRDGGKPRALVVTLNDNFITIRPLGTQREEVIDIESAYFGAIKARVWRAKMDRAKERVARKRK